jgi:histidyl-tRNA synthetase
MNYGCLQDLVASLRIKNYIKQLGAIDERQVEQFIARSANSQDPQKLLDVLEKIGNIGLDVPLVELEEYIKQKQAEKETLQHEIDEARTILDSVNVDRQIVEDYKVLKNEMDKYHLQDPKKFLNVLREFKKHNICEVCDVSSTLCFELSLTRVLLFYTSHPC